MEELQKNTEPEDSKEELNTSEGIAQELLKTAKKQLFYTRLSTCFVGVMAAAIAMIRETRAPDQVLVQMSRPKLSLPNQ